MDQCRMPGFQACYAACCCICVVDPSVYYCDPQGRPGQNGPPGNRGQMGMMGGMGMMAGAAMGAMAGAMGGF